MVLITCRCGKTQKNFMRNIGPFFINKCCKEAGYDAFGNMVAKPAPVEIEEPKAESEATVDFFETDLFKKLTAAELRQKAKEMGIEVSEKMSRKQLVAAFRSELKK